MKIVILNKTCFNETYCKVRKGKHLCDAFSIQNDLKQGDILSPFLFNFALEYAIWRVQENQEGLELSVTHEFLVYAADVHIQSESMKNMHSSSLAGNLF
jgi:hypothetical protein